MSENSNIIASGQTTITKPKKVLRIGQHDRTAGSMPVWEQPETQKEKIAEKLSSALTGRLNEQKPSFEKALAYNNIEPTASSSKQKQDQEFGFGDLIDMVNPLQHIPVVSHFYREITGDDIKPVAKIIGGTVFGGPAGAASGLVNAVVKHETGRDIPGNAMSLAGIGRENAFSPRSKISRSDDPEIRLNNALRDNRPMENLPGSLLSFADLGGAQRYKAMRIDEAEEAAYAKTRARLSDLPERAPITTFSLRR